MKCKGVLELNVLPSVGKFGLSRRPGVILPRQENEKESFKTETAADLRLRVTEIS